jgi:hypothetical protein
VPPVVAAPAQRPCLLACGCLVPPARRGARARAAAVAVAPPPWILDSGSFPSGVGLKVTYSCAYADLPMRGWWVVDSLPWISPVFL